MRLIDADALPRHKQLEAMGNGKYEDVEVVYERDIDNAPTVDAVPVRHGRWTHERLPSASGGSYAVVRCSACEYQYPMAETRYCPNCGAKMDDGYILITGKEQSDAKHLGTYDCTACCR